MEAFRNLVLSQSWDRMGMSFQWIPKLGFNLDAVDQNVEMEWFRGQAGVDSCSGTSLRGAQGVSSGVNSGPGCPHGGYLELHLDSSAPSTPDWKDVPLSPPSATPGVAVTSGPIF